MIKERIAWPLMVRLKLAKIDLCALIMIVFCQVSNTVRTQLAFSMEGRKLSNQQGAA